MVYGPSEKLHNDKRKNRYFTSFQYSRLSSQAKMKTTPSANSTTMPIERRLLAAGSPTYTRKFTRSRASASYSTALNVPGATCDHLYWTPSCPARSLTLAASSARSPCSVHRACGMATFGETALFHPVTV